MILPRFKPSLRAARHKANVRVLSRIAPYYLVNEFPKCGGTWAAQLLSGALGVPYKKHHEPIRIEPAVKHGHFLSPVGLHNVVVLWRDPRDMLVSFYYHCYFVNDKDNAMLVQLMKTRCPFEDYTDIRCNLPAFIRFVSHIAISPSFTWPEFARIWAGRPGTVQTSYEALRTDTPGELARVAEALTGTPLPEERAAEVAERHSFARAKQAAERARPGTAETSFVREGALGGWRRHFTPEAETALREGGYEEAMRTLGYTPGDGDGPA